MTFNKAIHSKYDISLIEIIHNHSLTPYITHLNRKNKDDCSTPKMRASLLAVSTLHTHAIGELKTIDQKLFLQL